VHRLETQHTRAHAGSGGWSNRRNAESETKRNAVKTSATQRCEQLQTFATPSLYQRVLKTPLFSVQRTSSVFSSSLNIPMSELAVSARGRRAQARAAASEYAPSSREGSPDSGLLGTPPPERDEARAPPAREEPAAAAPTTAERKKKKKKTHTKSTNEVRDTPVLGVLGHGWIQTKLHAVVPPSAACQRW
jgi:hypothetical protein